MRGEWVEMKFMVRAAEAGLVVSKPYGDSAQFDFIVSNGERMHRVQVRGTRMMNRQRYFFCRLRYGSPPKRFPRDAFDFLAVYVVPCDLWYVIPMAALSATNTTIILYSHIPNSRGQFEKYREAWHLLARSMGAPS